MCVVYVLCTVLSSTLIFTSILASDENIVFENEGYESLLFEETIKSEKVGSDLIYPQLYTASNSGHYDNFNWISEVPRKIKNPRTILNNKTVVMVGDSIFRKMRMQFHELISKCTPDENDWDFLGLEKSWCCDRFQNHCGLTSKSSQRHYCADTNTTLIFLHHGPPYQMAGNSCSKLFNNVEDVMDRMLEHNWVGRDFILWFDTGVHLSNHNPILLAGRLLSIRKKADELKKLDKWRNTVVVYRATTMNRGNITKTASLVSSFQQNRLNEVGVRIFKDSKSVVLMDSWPIIESMFDAMEFGNIHPPELILRAELSYFLDLYCFYSREC